MEQLEKSSLFPGITSSQGTLGLEGACVRVKPTHREKQSQEIEKDQVLLTSFEPLDAAMPEANNLLFLYIFLIKSFGP